jgi:hypothetical protein
MQVGSISSQHFRVMMSRFPLSLHIIFDGFETVVGKLLIHVTKHSITKTCRLPVYGERWWKKETLVMEFVNHFFIPERQNPNWSQGIPHNWVRK